MNSIAVASVVFACAWGGALFGILLQAVLPQRHLDKRSKEIILLCTGLIASMSAVVLGLLIAAAQSAFDKQQDGYQEIAANVLLLDRSLAQLGPEAKPARQTLHDALSEMIDHIWSKKTPGTEGWNSVELSVQAGKLSAEIRTLSGKNDAERAVHAQAIEVGQHLGEARARLSQPADVSIPRPFLVVLGFWFFVLFSSFGMFAPRNCTVFAFLLVSALSVAGGVFLIVDLDQPFDGLIRISSTPMRTVLSQINH